MVRQYLTWRADSLCRIDRSVRNMFSAVQCGLLCMCSWSGTPLAEEGDKAPSKQEQATSKLHLTKGHCVIPSPMPTAWRAFLRLGSHKKISKS